MSCDFVSLGFCSNDYVSLVPEIPLDNKIQMLKHLVQGGGPAANAAVTAARLGRSTAFLSTVGDDDPGRRIVRDLQAEGIETAGMVVRPGCESAIAYCWINEKTGQRSIVWTRGNLPELQANEVNLDTVRQAKVLHLDGHNPVGALAAAQAAKQAGVLVSLDAGTLRDGVPPLLPYVDLLIASETFARKFTGTDDLTVALDKLAAVGSRVVGITMGPQGSLARSGGKDYRCPAVTVQAVDTTGCGDSFHGAFAVRYQETEDVQESLRFASAVAALKCLQLGGRAGIPGRRQVEEFLQTH
ncbi:MAG: hypothetical protein J6866_07030 [Victivallales bacterium]|nr:hypothetical protein [Victivallales bacterium]